MKILRHYTTLLCFLLGVVSVHAQTPCTDGFIRIDGKNVDAITPENNDNTGLRLPLWLPAGSTLAAGSRVMFISVVEFNIQTVNGAQQLEFSRVIKVDSTTVTVPSGKTWKVESIVKYATLSTQTVTATSNSPVCQGANLQLNAPAIQGASYQWTGPAGFSSNVQNPVINGVGLNRQGTYTLTVTLNGCTTSATTSVSVQAKPNPAFTTSPSNAQVNIPVVFTPTTLGAAAYQWQFTSGSIANSTQSNPSVTWTSTGTYAVTLKVTDLLGCSDSTTQSVTINNCPSGSQTFNATNTGPSGSIQTFTVPGCVYSITINAKGAAGGGSNPGLGAEMQGTFAVQPGDVLRILVGQTTNGDNGGGGGTFVVKVDNSSSFVMQDGTKVIPLIIAGGGGGGTSGGTDNNAKHGTTATNGQTMGAQQGGTNGSGGQTYNCSNQSYGTGGGGFITNGGGSFGGRAFLNGGVGYSNGGYGGGGEGSGSAHGGGGGGYSGGGGTNISGCQSNYGPGGGGGSYNVGTNTSGQTGVRTGNGIVVINW